MKFIRQGLGIALQPELTLKSIAGELCSVPHEPTFYRQISLLAKEKPVEGSPLFLLFTTNVYGTTRGEWKNLM